MPRGLPKDRETQNVFSCNWKVRLMSHSKRPRIAVQWNRFGRSPFKCYLMPSGCLGFVFFDTTCVCDWRFDEAICHLHLDTNTDTWMFGFPAFVVYVMTHSVTVKCKMLIQNVIYLIYWVTYLYLHLYLIYEKRMYSITNKLFCFFMNICFVAIVSFIYLIFTITLNHSVLE